MTTLNLSGLRYNPDCLSYLSPKKKKIIFFSVLAAHFLFIICPLMFALFSDFTNPPIHGIPVTIFDDYIPGPPSKNPDKNNPTPSDELPAPPDKISDIPEVEPLPVPEQETPVVKPEKVEKIEKETTEKPIIKTEDKNPTIKEPKKNNFRKAEDITISNKVVKGAKSSPSNSTAKSGKASQFSKILKEYGTSTSAPGGGTGQIGKPGDDTYNSIIAAFLKSRWTNKPSTNTLGGKLPEVLIELKIDAAGNVIYSKIITPSGVSSMDMSIRLLLQDLTKVPVPPGEMTFQVTMKVKD